MEDVFWAGEHWGIQTCEDPAGKFPVDTWGAGVEEGWEKKEQKRSSRFSFGSFYQLLWFPNFTVY